MSLNSTARGRDDAAGSRASARARPSGLTTSVKPVEADQIGSWMSILPWSNARIASCRSLKRGTVSLVDLLVTSSWQTVMKYTPSTMSCDALMIGPPFAGLKMLCVESISTCASAWASTD
jgi:hypothetical protein